MATQLLRTLLVVLSLSAGTVYRPARVEAASQDQPNGPGYSSERVVREVRYEAAKHEHFVKRLRENSPNWKRTRASDSGRFVQPRGGASG